MDHITYNYLFSAMNDNHDRSLDDGKRGNRNDFDIMSVFADFLEENGDPRSEAARWMATKKKRPYTAHTPKPKEGEKITPNYDKAAWFCDGKVSADSGDPHSNLPEEIYKELTLVDEGGVTANHKHYPTWKQAVEAFHQAYITARQKGWKPEVST